MSDKIRTLSQAMRLGATFRPQHFYGLLEADRTCAIGAAAEGVGIDLQEKHRTSADVLAAIFRRLPIEVWAKAPINLCAEILIRNDGLKWTREQIADWLESQGL